MRGEKAMGQVVRAMSENMVKKMEHQRNWVKGHLTEDSILKYNTVEGKLLLLQGIIDAGYLSERANDGITIAGCYIRRFIGAKPRFGVGGN